MAFVSLLSVMASLYPVNGVSLVPANLKNLSSLISFLRKNGSYVD